MIGDSQPSGMLGAGRRRDPSSPPLEHHRSKCCSSATTSDATSTARSPTACALFSSVRKGCRPGDDPADALHIGHVRELPALLDAVGDQSHSEHG
jgi:hypothetical protein